MTGFLDDSDLDIIRVDKLNLNKNRIREKEYTCIDCRLDNKARNPKIAIYGKGKRRIMLVLETPDYMEDKKGGPWKSVNGIIIRDLLKETFDLDVERDCWTVYAVRCAAGGPIKSVHCEACRKYLHNDIKQLKPLVIIPFGYYAVMGISGDILTSKSRGKTALDWTGFMIPDQRFGAWIAPTWGIHYLELDTRYPDVVKRRQLLDHVKAALRKKEPPEIIDYKEAVKVLYSDVDILALFKLLETQAAYNKALCLALDYETTGRKPHREGHKIISIGLSDGDIAWAFQVKQDNEDIRTAFFHLLDNEFIAWRVHNLQFEYLWSAFFYNTVPRNLDHDTILGLHVLNSQKRKGLKPNVYCLFGVAGYDDSTEGYISAPPKEEKKHGANSFNLMDQAPLDDVLLYNGLDALFTYKIGNYINEAVRPENWAGYDFLMESGVNLVKAQNNGMLVDLGGVAEAKEMLTGRLNEIEKRIQKRADKYGWDKPGRFRPAASADISYLLFDVMGLKSGKDTATGRPATDKETLEKIKDPIIEDIGTWKRLQKLRDTYINGLVIESVDQIIHPFFNLYSVKTFRSSCLGGNTKIQISGSGATSELPIKRVRAGDRVICLDDDLQLTARIVLWAGCTGEREVIRVWYENYEQKPFYLDITAEHLCRVPDGSYCPAGSLLDDGGKMLLSYITFGYKVTKIERTGKIIKVYDLKVAEFNNFIANGVCVHNSSDPNFQNVPKRDKEGSKIIRSLLFPHKGQKLAEYDFKAVEVGTGACYHKDPTMISYIENPKNDMHRDTGIELFMYEDNVQDFSKFDRQIAKNRFVFPEFYGSYFEQTAPDLWTYCSKEARANLRRNGVRNLKDFTEHVREVEDIFWNERFPVYTAWKKDLYKFYLKHGYVDSLTGFRYYGPMTKNEVLNTAIQGSAHHILLYLFNRLSDAIERKKLKTKMIGQIHDSAIPSVQPEEEPYIDKLVWYYGTQKVREDFDWIIVPLQIEKSAAPVDRPWSEMEELGMLGKNGKLES